MQIDLKQLKRICNAPTEYLLDNKSYKYVDNKSNILAVAHCDTVGHGDRFEAYRTKDEKDVIVFSPHLDDRLGVYILHELSKIIKIDILLTDDEEIGASTASMFETTKHYDWMFSFDRAGIDVVMYQYFTSEWKQKMIEYGLVTEHGSYSDIDSLGHLGCVGFNFGTGYYNQHTQYSFASVAQILSQTSIFLNFYEDFKKVHLPYTPAKKYAYEEYDRYGYSRGMPRRATNATYYDWSERECPMCHSVQRTSYDWTTQEFICAQCKRDVEAFSGYKDNCDNCHTYSDVYFVNNMYLCLKCIRKQFPHLYLGYCYACGAIGWCESFNGGSYCTLCMDTGDTLTKPAKTTNKEVKTRTPSECDGCGAISYLHQCPTSEGYQNLCMLCEDQYHNPPLI